MISANLKEAYECHGKLVSDAFEYQRTLKASFKTALTQETWDDTLEEIATLQKELDYWANLIEAIKATWKEVEHFEEYVDADE